MIDYGKDTAWNAVFEQARCGECFEFDPVRLALDDPGEYERLLRSYWLLLGQRKSWWERADEAQSPRWRDCIRSAIVGLANICGLRPRELAAYLDLDEFPRARARVLALARERFAR